jgi:hypothetical protein
MTTKHRPDSDFPRCPYSDAPPHQVRPHVADAQGRPTYYCDKCQKIVPENALRQG